MSANDCVDRDELPVSESRERRTIQQYKAMMGSFDHRFGRADHPTPCWDISTCCSTWLQWRGMAEGGGFRVVCPVAGGLVGTSIIVHDLNEVSDLLRLIP